MIKMITLNLLYLPTFNIWKIFIITIINYETNYKLVLFKKEINPKELGADIIRKL
jgi:hypothetical protein